MNKPLASAIAAATIAVGGITTAVVSHVEPPSHRTRQSITAAPDAGHRATERKTTEECARVCPPHWETVLREDGECECFTEGP